MTSFLPATRSQGATGFQEFRCRLDTAAALLGGSPGTWEAVAKRFDSALVDAVAARQGKRRWDIPFGVGYLAAEDADLARAAEAAEASLFRLRNAPALAEASWGGAKLLLREDGVWLQGTGAEMPVVLVGEPRDLNDRAGRKSGEQFSVGMTDDGKLCCGRNGSASRASVAYAKSREGAAKAAGRVAEEFFGVKLSPVAAGKAAREDAAA